MPLLQFHIGLLHRATFVLARSVRQCCGGSARVKVDCCCDLISVSGMGGPSQVSAGLATATLGIVAPCAQLARV